MGGMKKKKKMSRSREERRKPFTGPGVIKIHPHNTWSHDLLGFRPT